MQQINDTSSQQLKWNWDDASQSILAFNGLKCELISRCLAKDNCGRNYTGVPLGIGYAALSLAAQISLIAEQLIKGIVNVLGSCMPGCDFSAKVGAGQLYLAAENCVLLLIGLPIVGVLAIFVIPVMTFFAPDFTLDTLTKVIIDPSPQYEQASFNDNDVLTEFNL